jgi:hypothetical protein
VRADLPSVDLGWRDGPSRTGAGLGGDSAEARGEACARARPEQFADARQKDGIGGRLSGVGDDPRVRPLAYLVDAQRLDDDPDEGASDRRRGDSGQG